MKRRQSDSEVTNGLTAACYRQTASKSVTMFHEMPPERFDIAIEMESSRGFDVASEFSFSTVDRASLSKLVKEKSLDEFAKLGGLEGITASLETDGNRGIKGEKDEILCRNVAFGANTYNSVQPAKTTFFHVVWEACKDPTIVILLVCSALSLGVGIKAKGLQEGWYDGGGLLIAVFLVISVSAVSNFRQSRQFDKLSKVSNKLLVQVVRNGRRQMISIFEVVVGDVVCVSIGDQVPADGLFIEGHSLLVDESSMTGESDHVEINSNQNPFLLSGTKVADGYGRMLVTSVGMNTAWGEMMSTITDDFDEQTPLQARLNKLTSTIGKAGLTVAFLVLVLLLVRYFTGNTKDDYGNIEFNGSSTKIYDVINSIVRIISVAVTIVLVAIPGGLSLAVTLTLAYSMKRMMANKALVRKLSACETMGMVTTVCMDTPGTPPSNQLKVAKVFIGTESMEARSYTSIAPKVLQQLFHGINLARDTVQKLFPVTHIDDAIHLWAVIKQNMEFESVRDLSILGVEASCPEKKKIGILAKNKSDQRIHAYWRGDAELIISSCSHYYDAAGNIIVLDDQKREKLEQILESMAVCGLLCFGFGHKQLSDDEYDNENDNRKIPDKGLILSGYVGLKVPHHPNIKEAIESCQLAGVSVKMITSKNAVAAKAIARECGLLSSSCDDNDDEQLVVEAMEFLNYTDEERMEKVNNIRVMTRSSPFDKLLMVQCLKRKGHVVAVTGDGTIDAPAFKEADIGLSMGIQGTDVAKESSDIIILDDNFASVATVLKWGRRVYTNIQKFIQFQLTATVVTLVINFVAAISTGKTPLSPVQFLWVNLIVDTLAAVAFATETPSISCRRPPPVSRDDPIITNVMWRNISGQTLYQIAVLLVIMFKSESISGDHGTDEIDTIIFNTFVLLQVFNLVNARMLQEKNVFEGLIKNKTLIGINGIIIIFQVVMVQYMNKLCHTKGLNWKEWGVCVGIAVFSWPIGWLVKFIPVPARPTYNKVRKGSWFIV